MKWNKNAAVSVGIYSYIYSCNDFWYGWGRVVQPKKIGLCQENISHDNVFCYYILFIKASHAKMSQINLVTSIKVTLFNHFLYSNK